MRTHLKRGAIADTTKFDGDTAWLLFRKTKEQWPGMQDEAAMDIAAGVINEINNGGLLPHPDGSPSTIIDRLHAHHVLHRVLK